MALTLAFAAGFVATRLKLPAIVGYLFAGVVVGPFTPGFEASSELAPQLAEIGVILLMFGVGIHFSIERLLSVWKVAVPGAIFQSAVATLLAIGVTRLWGWDLAAGLVVGLALSVASTVVLLRALIDYGLVDSPQGRVAVGWLIVEDLFTVLALVFLPMLATDATSASDILVNLAVTTGKVVVLVAGVLFVGGRIVPWLLIHVSRTGSTELFTLAVLATTFGIAFGSATVFGVSMALGAFLGGLVMGESDLSHRAAEEALPMRDAFAVLFFVSVGMLFDPWLLPQYAGEILAVVLIVVVAKPLAAYGLVALLGHPRRTGLVVAAGLAQIGEFSFILAELGHSLDLIRDEAHGMILAAAMISITLNPFMFSALERVEGFLRRREVEGDLDVPEGFEPEPLHLSGHVVLCGYGRVGRVIHQALEQHPVQCVIVEHNRAAIDELRERGVAAILGDAGEHAVQAQLDFENARLLVLALPDPVAVRQIAEVARERNPALPIIARTHTEDEWHYLLDGHVDEAVLGERELAHGMARLSLRYLGLQWDDPTVVGGSTEHGDQPPESQAQQAAYRSVG